jgi:hypothetical protein
MVASARWTGTKPRLPGAEPARSTVGDSRRIRPLLTRTEESVPIGVYERKRSDPAKRFWARVSIGRADACWEWTGPTNKKGYGSFRIEPKGKARNTSRIAWMFTHGDPGTLWVLHKCDNPTCCNPGHLFLGTHQDNTDDMVAKDRQQRGERHYSAKLTPQQAREIRRRRLAGESLKSLSLEFGIVIGAICNIAKGRSWKSAK